MAADWQIGFRAKGLRAPVEANLFEDYVLVRGIPDSDDSYVFFRINVRNDEEKEGLRDTGMNLLRTITEIYSLVTDRYAEAESGSAAVALTPERPFGYMQYPPDMLRFIPIPTDEQRKVSTPLLRKTMHKYELVWKIYKKNTRSYLRNAIDYYHRSLGDIRLEERLIDLMIALESLFSLEVSELRLRYSLRASFFLGAGQERETTSIFSNIYDLYDKRSKVVHGTEDVNLNGTDISFLQQHLKEAIKRFIHINMSKRDIIRLIDESIYNKSKREQLNQIVSKAVEEW